MYEDPITDIRLVKCPISIDEKNQITFSNQTAQLNYFLGLEHLDLNDTTYQRRDSVIRYEACIENLDQYNYVMYKNANYRDKWFFAFITSMKWANNNMTDIFIKTDSFQTWQFDLEYKASFVEREHVNDDTIGLHTLDEPVGTGEYINNNFGVIDTTGLTQKIVIGVSKCLDGMFYYKNRQYTGVYSGLYLYTFEVYDNKSVNTWVSEFIKAYDNAGYGGDIVELFLVPDSYISVDSNDWYTLNADGVTIHYGLVAASNPTSSTLTTININSTIDGYTPKNNKLFTAPFNYLYLSNNVGGDVIYHYEDFANHTPKFLTDGVISPGCNIRVYPIDYKRQTDDTTMTIARRSFQYGLTAGKLPVCSWNSDSYTNWLTQNGVNVATQVVTSAAAGSVGAFTGNAMTAVSGFAGVVNAIDSVRRADMIPNTVGGNINGSDVAYSTRNLNVTYSQMSVRTEVARMIDSFFTMYGYKVNTLKVPNITGRSNWNYVKTIDCNIEAFIPQEDLQNIKDMFNNGVTFWHTTQYFLDYSRTNSIV